MYIYQKLILINIILYITTSIINIVFIIIDFKNDDSYINKSKTIEILIKYNWFTLLLCITPILNILLFIIYGFKLLWNKIKNIKL